MSPARRLLNVACLLVWMSLGVSLPRGDGGRHPGHLHPPSTTRQMSIQDCRLLSTSDAKVDCLLAVLYGVSEQRQSSSPNVQTNVHMDIQTPSWVSALDYGAVGDGITDNTEAIQSALNAMGNAGGGIVLVPRGVYRCNGSLSVPKATTLQGTFNSVPSHAGLVFPGSSKPGDDGTVLAPYGGEGDASGTPFITLTENSVLKGVVIYYPRQVRDAQPIPFPWSISMVGNNPAVTDVEIVNSYNGILAVGAGRHYIARVQGQPLNNGIYVDKTFDIGRIENVHFNPWFASTSQAAGKWMKFNGTAFTFARSDWEYVFNTFAFGYNIGYRFIASQDGSCNGNFVGVGADYATTAAVQVDQADPFGILITNGEFVAFDGPDPQQVVVSASNHGAVRFVNSAFWGPSNQIAKIEGTGSVTFSECVFDAWDTVKENRAALQAFGSGSMSVRGCEFHQDAPSVELGQDLAQAVIVGNTFKGAENIVDHGCHVVQKGLNAEGSSKR